MVSINFTETVYECYGPYTGNGSVLIGQEPDELNHGFSETQAFSGKVASVGIWKRLLSVSEIEDLAKCNNKTSATLYKV